MTNLFCKGGRPPVANKCNHHVKVSFDDLEWDELSRMMEKADATVKSTFIKQLISRFFFVNFIIFHHSAALFTNGGFPDSCDTGVKELKTQLNQTSYS